MCSTVPMDVHHDTKMNRYVSGRKCKVPMALCELRRNSLATAANNVLFAARWAPCTVTRRATAQALMMWTRIEMKAQRSGCQSV